MDVRWWEALHDVVVERIDVVFERRNEVVFRLRRLPDAMLGRIPIAVPGSRAEQDRPTGPPRAPGTFAIRCSGFRRLTCPRLEPWGRSQHASINEACLGEGDSTQKLAMQLTSGDEIEVEAEKIEFLSD